MGFANIAVETDFTFVVNALCRRHVHAGPLCRVLQEILVLASEFSSQRILFCYPKANGAVDSLAKHAATTQGRFVLHSSALSFCWSLCVKISSGW